MMRTLLLIVLMATLVAGQAGTTLDTYPEPFVQNGVFDGKIVVGKNAASSDVIGAIDIAASLIAESSTDIALGRMDALFDSHLGVLDVDAPQLGTQPMIVVGGPCANSVAAALLGYPQPCNEGFQVGKARIQYFPESKALLIAGFDAQETLAASYVLADYKDYDLSGLQSEVTIADQDVLNIRQVQE
jgi:hypothetical protein